MFKKLIGVVALVALVAAFATVASGCGASPTARASSSNVTVIAKEFSFTPSVTSVKAGQVTFTLDNQGSMVHEMVLLKTDLPVDKLPMSADDPSTVDEDAAGAGPGEVADVDPGESVSETFDLAAGRYLLLCNQPGHYKAGMVAEFTVTQ